MYCICYILTQTKNVKTKAWIKNDHGLIRDDINQLIKSFEDDIDKEYIELRCLRIYSILQITKLSTTHLTQHTLPLELQNFNPYCSNHHVLFECMIHPDKVLNFKQEQEQQEIGDIKLIKCKQCRLYINIQHRVNQIGYYFCGHLKCLQEDILFCANCCNN
eukprot:TRINITY_DN104_c1_g1_i3.p1 TRINITY_DN104_c1_g1~~TRINITY_DN104_c1_g1_i3.p1  ORF type:complete len:161 (-),score=2.91 TRINITY_DN104_c1_g1_i3:134-616(-)